METELLRRRGRRRRDYTDEHNYTIDSPLKIGFDLMLDGQRLTLICCIPSTKTRIIIGAEQSSLSLLMKIANEGKVPAYTTTVSHYDQHCPKPQ